MKSVKDETSNLMEGCGIYKNDGQKINAKSAKRRTMQKDRTKSTFSSELLGSSGRNRHVMFLENANLRLKMYEFLRNFKLEI